MQTSNQNKVYKKYLFMKICMSTSLFLPIRILYMIYFNISDSQISILKAIFSLIIVLFEVPTGVISDKISKKVSLSIGSLLFAIHSLFYILTPTFTGFILTQVCLGISSTFISGADIGYLHDYIEKFTKDEFIKVKGKISLYSKYFSALFSLISSILFSINIKLNFGISALLGTIAFIIISTLPNDLHKEDDNKSHSFNTILHEYSTQIIDVAKYTFSNKLLRKITLLTAINYSFLIFNFEYYQVTLSDYGFKIQFYGLLYASFMVLMGYGARLSSWINSRLNTNKIFSLYMFLIGTSYILIGVHKSIILVFISIILQQMCYGSWGLIAENIILDEVPQDDVKSTLISLNSLFVSLIRAIIIFILGGMLRNYSYTTIYLLMGAIVWGIALIHKISKPNNTITEKSPSM